MEEEKIQSESMNSASTTSEASLGGEGVPPSCREVSARLRWYYMNREKVLAQNKENYNKTRTSSKPITSKAGRPRNDLQTLDLKPRPVGRPKGSYKSQPKPSPPPQPEVHLCSQCKSLIK